jgi:hypothetical protein
MAPVTVAALNGQIKEGLYAETLAALRTGQ